MGKRHSRSNIAQEQLPEKAGSRHSKCVIPIAPTLVIRAGNDAAGSTEDNKKLIERLGSKVKKYVEIPVGGHYIFFEKSNAEFYRAIKDFLEEKTE